MKNRYGSFDAEGSYILNHPDTPAEWENKLFNDEYVLDISQRLEGTSYIVKNYVQTKIIASGRRFYIRINGNAHRLFFGDNGIFRAEYHTDKMTAVEETQEYKVTAEVTVPEKGRREIWRITAENKSDKADFDIFCFFPFVNSGPMDGECTLSGDRRCVYKFSFPYHVFYEDMEKVAKNHGYTFVAADCEISSFDGDGRAFFGSDNREALPIAVQRGRCSNTAGQGDRLDCALHFGKEIEKGGSLCLTLTAGAADTYEEIDSLKCNFPRFDISYKRAKIYRDKHYKGYSIETPCKELNHIFNKWLPKQLVYLARHNRGGVYCPVRNRLQDALGYSILDPDGALEIALSILHRQQFDGYLKQWYMTDGSPERDLCKINHSDACIWLVLCVTEIINNCGNIKIFYREEPYMDTDTRESVLMHLKKAVQMRGGYSLIRRLGLL